MLDFLMNSLAMINAMLLPFKQNSQVLFSKTFCGVSKVQRKGV